MKLYIINLATLGFPGAKNIDLSAIELYKLQQIIKDKNNYILLHATMEFWDSRLINAVLTMLGVQPNQENIRLLVEECKMLNPFDDPINFDYICYYNDNMLKNDTTGAVNNTEVNLNCNKFLYIVGKSYKRHRISLLYKLHQKGLLDYCNWSFRISKPEETRKLLSEIDDNEYDKFINAVTKDLDIPSSTKIYQPEHSSIYGWPTEEWLYKDTSFTLLSETHCDPKYVCFITEKTWRAIANKHVFVTASYINNYELLESIGIDTFQYALLHKKEKFTLDKDVDAIVDMTIENVEYLLSNIDKFKEQLTQSIENNLIALNNRISHFRNIVDPCIEPYILKPYYYKKETLDIVEGEDAEKAIKKLWC